MCNTLHWNLIVHQANCQHLLASTVNDPQSIIRWSFLLGLIALTILLGVIAYILIRNRLIKQLDNTRSMFRDLCRAHDLNKTQVKLLQRLAGTLPLTSPSALFVDSSLWRIPDDGKGARGLTTREWEKLQIVRRVLFMPPAVKPS